MSPKIITKKPQRFFSIREVSEILGVSRFTVGRLIAFETLPVVRIPGRGRKPIIRVDSQALEKLVEASKMKSANPPRDQK